MAAGPKGVYARLIMVGARNAADYFSDNSGRRNSQTFVCGIPSSSGIEEGKVQVYAIPGKLQPWVSDPGSDQSTLLLMHVDNESGQLVEYAYLLNATTMNGLLNFTVTPSEQGLSISAGDNGFNASISFFSATGQSYSSSQVLDVQVGRMQQFNVTCPAATFMTCVSSSKSVVGQGYSTALNITVTNQNTSPIVSNVTVYCNEEIVSNLSSVTLPANSSTTVELDWNTTGFAYGNYTVSAVTDMNYNCTGVQVTVSVAGDINGDGTVDIYDAILLSAAFNSKPGMANWNPNADINGDGIVDIYDAMIMSGYFNQHIP